MTRTKSAVIAFVVLAVAGIAAVSFDYTDTYVADRFHEALREKRYELDSPISLDRFVEYYDWDEVCVFIPGMQGPELKNQFGLTYKHKVTDTDSWSLVFVKEYYVEAVIPIKRSELEFPDELDTPCFKRWAAIVEIVDDGMGLRMNFVGN